MTKTLTKASGWTAEFSKLPGIKDGQPIVYSVEETNTPDGYTSKVEPINESNVIKVVNTSNKPKVLQKLLQNLVVKKAFQVAGDQGTYKTSDYRRSVQFVLRGENKKVVETAKNQADGTVSFKSLTFNKEGTHTYTITENKGTDANVNYSAQSITATVDVKTDDKLVATVSYSGGDGEQKNTITNTQNKPKVSNAKVTLKLKKTFEGGELKGDDFEFVVKDSNDKVVGTTKNKKDGSITFDNITVDKAGTFKYTITETKGTDKTITYSDKTITQLLF